MSDKILLNLTPDTIQKKCKTAPSKLNNYATNNCVLYFTADWCGPCWTTTPILERLAKTYQHQPKLTIGQVNVDVYPEIAKRFFIRIVPTVLYIKNGVEQRRKKGVNTYDDYEQQLQQLLSLP